MARKTIVVNKDRVKEKKDLIQAKKLRKEKLNKTKRSISLREDDEFHVSIMSTPELQQTIKARRQAAELITPGDILDGTPRRAHYHIKLKSASLDQDADLYDILHIARMELLIRVAADNLLLKLLDYPRKVDLSSYERALFSFPALADAARENSQYQAYKVLFAAVEELASGEVLEDF